MIKACLNGDRSPRDHPRVPLTAAQLAADAAAVKEAGAFMVHVHPRDRLARESLEHQHIVDSVTAIRAACPGLRVSVSTREGIVDGATEKLACVSKWPSPGDGGPDCASVNWHEPGAIEIATALRGRGIGVEAGIWTAAAAELFVATGWPSLVERVLVEVIPGVSPSSGGVVAAKQVLTALGDIDAPVLVHGEHRWAWPVLRWAQSSGFDVRVGLEDTLARPDGAVAADNAELVRTAAPAVPLKSD